MQPTLNLVITGGSTAELIANGKKMLAVLEGGKATKTSKRAPAAAIDEEDQVEMSSDEEDTETLEASADSDDDMFGTDEEEVVEEAPKTNKKAKGNGASKLTAAEINDACKTHAKKYGREKTLGVLRKFKVKSVTELSTDQYPQVLKALTGK